MPDDWTTLLDELRASQFSDLAKAIEEHLAAGKAIAVEEKRQGRYSTFEPIVSFSAQNRDEQTLKTRYDVQVVPYGADEREKIVLEAIREHFVAPAKLSRQVVEGFRGMPVSFASSVEPDEEVSLRQYEEFLTEDSVDDLKTQLVEHSDIF
jgi:hypothetical protein